MIRLTKIPDHKNNETLVWFEKTYGNEMSGFRNRQNRLQSFQPKYSGEDAKKGCNALNECVVDQ